MKKRTGKMISLSLAVAMAVTAAPVTALADENTQGSVIEASELTPAQSAAETETTTVDTKEEEGTAWAALTPVEKVEEEATTQEEETKTEVTVSTESDLIDAVADEKNKEKTIVITEDIELTKTLTITQNITLEGRKDGNSDQPVTISGNVDASWDGIVITEDATDVSLKNLNIVDFGGNTKGNNAIRIGYRKPTDRTQLFDGTVTIEKCTIENFGKNGITAFGGDITVKNCTIKLSGGVEGRTPNGIQLSDVKNATIEANTIIGFESTHEDWTATGILLTEGAEADITSNKFESCDQGIAISDYYDSYFQYDGTKKPSIKNIESVVSKNTFTGFDGEDAKNRVTSTVPPNNAVFVNKEGNYSFVDADEVYYTAGANSDNTELKCFPSLEDAIQGAPEGKTIVLTEDITLTNTITVNKNVSISGKTPDGTVHTITGDNKKVYSAFVIEGGEFSIEDVNVTQFGGNHEVGSKAVFSVPKTAADTSFEAKNVNVSDFNRTAFDIRSGSFGIRECVIDCKNTYSQTPNAEKVLTKGILAGLGTNKVEGLIEDIEIKGADSKYDEWDSAGIEIYTNADVTIDGGSITAGSTGIWVDNYYGDAGNTATVKIQDVAVDAKDAVKVYYADDTGKTGQGEADVTIKSGNFTGKVRIVGGEDSKTNNIDISGGTFSQSVSMFADRNGYQVAGADGTYSYYTTEEAANTAAKPGDIISSVADEINPSKEEVTVTINYNDGSTPTETKTIIKGSTYCLPDPNRSGYNLTSWTDNDNKSYKAGESVTISNDTTFTAQWSKKSSGGSHRYDNYITVITPKNGEVSVSDDWAYVGDKVTLTVTPDKGYVVDKIEIVDEEGEKLEAKKVDDKDNEYTFKVKNSDVTVTVTFKEEGKKTEETDKEDDKTEETTETPETTTPESTTFSDVNESDWFFKGVEYVVDKDIMSGVSENEFAPSGKLTRAMLVQMLYNMESRPACDAENAFMDVPVGQWYTDAVIWANDEKIVSGMGDGLFAPNMEITREQMVVMLYNYAKYKGYDVTASADLSKFADNASVSTWAQPAMQWAVAEGYISGMGDNQLAPQGTATRAEIASVIMRFMEATAESAETAE